MGILVIGALQCGVYIRVPASNLCIVSHTLKIHDRTSDPCVHLSPERPRDERGPGMSLMGRRIASSRDFCGNLIQKPLASYLGFQIGGLLFCWGIQNQWFLSPNMVDGT